MNASPIFKPHSCDIVVLGAGPAGYVAAIRLAQLGKKVTVVERDEVGGVCLNRGCIPSKALIHASSLADQIRHGAEIGITAGEPKVDLRKLIEWKGSVVKKLTSGIQGLFKANGVTWLKGDARFNGGHSMEVRGPESWGVTFNTCVIATGSRPASLPGFAVDQKKILDSTGALDLTELPKTLLCIGGGYIGLELGTYFAKLGTQVTVVEAGPTLLPGVDPELSRVVQRKLEKRGVKIQLNAKADPAMAQAFDRVLVTIGRTPNTDGIGLEKLGLKLDAKGFIAVNAKRQTHLPHVYAIGDVAGQPLLAHKGSKEGIVAAEAIAGKPTVYDVVAMPAVIFTDPEIATVGMTEAEARAKPGLDVMVGQFPLAANGRALTMGASEGFVKTVGDRKTGRLLGVHIVGAEASNLISEAALALELGAQVEDLALTVHPHPTLGENLMESAEATLGHAIHLFQKKATDAAGGVSGRV